jgi:DNA polymerase I-like protein with 3'-5' exonuclease and polymerase domains
LKFINTKLSGNFLDKDGKEYRVDSQQMSTKDLINFYLIKEDGTEMLMCSVFTKYLSKAIGVKKAGEIVREVYGDYQVYTNYESLRNQAITQKNVPDGVKRKIVDEKLNKFVDILEKKSADFYHKLVYSDGTIVEEIIQYRSEEGGISRSLRMELLEEGKKVQINKLKGVEYVLRDEDNKGKDLGIINIQSLDYIALKKDITWMKERNYRIIDTEEDLLAYLAKMEETDDIVAFDTETSGLSINRLSFDHPKRDHLVGICLSIEKEEGVYIPLKQKKFNNIDEKFAIETLRPYLSSEGAKVRNIVTHYGSFDWKVMYGYGYDLHITDDTYILQYLIDVREANSVKKLKVMSEKILGLQMIDLEDFFPSIRGGKRGNIQFSLLPYESVRHYGPTDADITRELYFELRPKLPNDMRFIYGVEIDLMKRLGKVEYYGIKIDLQKTIEMTEKVKQEKLELEQQIYHLAGEVFNINSGDQLERILFDKLKYPSHGTTASGKRSTGKQVLEILSGDKDKNGKILYPLASMIFTYKKKEKLLNSFLEKILRENVEGFLFPKYNQAGTQSGRISGNNPNLQQTSGLIRELFIPDTDDYYFLVVDYSQVEYRIMAGLADQYDLVEFFRGNPEADFHIMMYAQMYGVPYEKVTSSQRKVGKTINFGVSYGMSPASLAIKLYGSSTKEQTADAEKKIVDYFDSVANIRDYMTVIKDGAQLRGFVKTLFNRRRYISEFMKENPKYYEIEKGKRKAGNTVVQGTAADIMKFAHVRVENALDKLGLDVRVVASIHDELVISVNKKYNPWKMIDIVRSAMELDLSKYNFPPLYIGANVGNSWGDGKKDNLEAPVLLMERKRQEVLAGLHEEGYENPTEVFSDELRKFALEVVMEEISKANTTTVETSLEIPRLSKYAGAYLGADAEFAIKGVLAGETLETVFSQLGKSDILGEGYYDEVDDDSDELENIDEDPTTIHYDKLQNYYEENKDLLQLESPILRKAKEVYNEGYSVMGYDRKLIVRIEKPNEAMLKELISYFDSINVPKGYEVSFQLGSKYKTTSFKTTKIDRIAIISIIEKHLDKLSEVV